MSNYIKTPRKMSFPESSVQVAIVQYLQLNKIYCHSVPNERKCTAQAMGRFIAMGLKSGCGDLLIWYPNDWDQRREVYKLMAEGTSFSNTPLVTMGYIEVKAPGKKQSEAQKRFEARCNAVGISYDLAYSVLDVEKILKKRYT